MVGNNIKHFRVKQRISQTKLARLINIRQESLSRIESGYINPSIKTLERIAKVLGVSIVELLDEEENHLKQDAC